MSKRDLGTFLVDPAESDRHVSLIKPSGVVPQDLVGQFVRVILKAGISPDREWKNLADDPVEALRVWFLEHRTSNKVYQHAFDTAFLHATSPSMAVLFELLVDLGLLDLDDFTEEEGDV